MLSQERGELDATVEMPPADIKNQLRLLRTVEEKVKNVLSGIPNLSLLYGLRILFGKAWDHQHH